LFFVTFVSKRHLAGSSLGEVALALLGLDIVDIELCDSGSRRTLVQVLLELLQGAAVTLSLTSDLSMEISTIVIGE
jgi:hypothetical protein